MVHPKAARASWAEWPDLRTILQKTAEMAWVSLSIFRGPLICRTVQISYRYVHVPVLPSRCAVMRFLSPNLAAQNQRSSLLCTLPHQLADLALDCLVVETCYPVVSSKSCCDFLAPNLHVQTLATLFLDSSTHLKAPRPFPVRTRSVRTREAVC